MTSIVNRRYGTVFTSRRNGGMRMRPDPGGRWDQAAPSLCALSLRFSVSSSEERKRRTGVRQGLDYFLSTTDTSRPPLWSVIERASPGETAEESVTTAPVSALEVME